MASPQSRSISLIQKKFELKTYANSKHLLNLKATNGKVMVTSTMWDTLELSDE